MGKKYLDTKKDSLEQSILGVWKTAVEEGSGRMDGKEHRKKLESVRTKRESTIKTEEVDLEEKKETAQYTDGGSEKITVTVDNMRNVNIDTVITKNLKPGWKKVEKKSGGIGRSIYDEVETESYEIGTDEYRKYMERLTPGENIEEKSGDKEAYQKFFNSALKKFGVKSPAELEGDKKKEFYDYVDKNWTGDHEEAFEFAKESKVSSVLDTVKNMWRMDEKVKKEDDDKEIKGDKTLTGKKSASVEIDPDIEEKHKKKVHASKAY